MKVQLHQNGNIIVINTNEIAHVVKYGENKTIIIFSNKKEITVDESPYQIAKLGFKG